MLPCSKRFANAKITSNTTTAVAGAPINTTASSRIGSDNSSSPGWKRTAVDTVKLKSE